MDITQIIVSIIGACSLIITGVLIPILVKRYGSSKLENIQEYFETIYKWANAACSAAEVLFNAAGQGEDKRNYVTEYITSLCARYGLTVDMDTIRQAIEKACRELGFVK